MSAPTIPEQDAHDEWAGIEYRNAVEFSARDLAISRAAWNTRAALPAGPVEQGEQG